MKLRKDILTAFYIQAIVIAIIFVGWMIGFSIEKIGLFISPIIYVVALVMFYVLEKNKNKVHTVTFVTSFATGILIGSFISEYSNDIIITLKTFLVLILFVIFIHGLLLIIPYPKTITILAILLIMPAIIFGFTKFDLVFAKGLTLLGINLLFTLIGLLIYFYKNKNLDRYMAGSLLWAFIVIFIIIIIILSEGEALSGLDGADISSNKKRKKKV